MSGPWIQLALLTERQEFQQLLAADGRAAAARAGLGIEVVFAGNDPALQLQQLQAVIGRSAGQRPLAIVVETAGSAGFERVARAAVEAGIGWAILSGNSAYVQGLHAEFKDRVVTAVVNDGDAVGRLQAAQVRALLPAGGPIVVVEGPSLVSASIRRRRGLEDGLAGSAVQLVKTLTGDWTTASGERAAASWLALAGKAAARPALIVGQNDEMAVGARKAVQAARPEWGAVPAIGVDGLPEGGLRSVREGVLAATVVMAPPSGHAIGLVAAAARGGARPPSLVHLSPRAHPAPEKLAAL